jgi:hypothetical protein
MNGSDIRFLAERASALEDRSTDRVGEIHERIAARRQRRTAAVVAAVATIAVVAVSLFTVTSGSDDAPEPAPVPGSTAPPEREDCWAVPPASLVDPNHIYDDSPQVPCTSEHTTETVLSYPLEEATREAGEEYVDRCGEAVRAYLGLDEASWIPWGFFLVLPSEQQVEDGAAWARCDAALPATWSWSAPRTLTASVLGVADERPAAFWACLDEPPTVLDQPFVPCDRPHAYEQTGTLATFGSPETFPTKAERDDATQEQCSRAVPTSLAGAAVVASWPSSRGFEPYAAVGGVCFMFNADGQPLPAR